MSTEEKNNIYESIVEIAEMLSDLSQVVHTLANCFELDEEEPE